VRVFLAGIIQGSLQDPTIHGQDWRARVKAMVARHLPDAEVYDHFARHPAGIGYDLPAIRATLAEGNAACAASDLVICWLPEASMGTAIEMYLAHEAGRTVLTVSPMAPNWVIRAYSTHIFSTLDALECFFAAGGFDRPMIS
jgi:hypothetical protein